VIRLGLGGLRHSQECLSIQAEYNLTSVLEGNTVGDVVKLLGDVGRQVEMGTSIRIIRRVIAKNKVIRPYYCVIQYQS
jgi:hypothetical protein